MAHLVVVESKPTVGLDLIREASALGHEVTFVAHTTEPYLRSEGAADALLHAARVLTPVVTTDPDAVLEALRGTAGPIDGVTTISAGHIGAVARIAARLGLPGERPEVAARLLDKHAVRSRLAAAGVPQPPFREARGIDEALSAAVDLGYPVVVKPCDGSGSRGVGVARRPEQVADLAAAILRTRDYGRSIPAAGRVLVERYVPGPVVSCEMLTVDGRHLPYGCTDRLLSPPPHPVELGGCFPADLPPARADEVRRICAAALDAVGVTRAHTHTEVVLGPDGPRIIEINGRLVGGPVPELMNLVLARDVYHDVVALALGGSPEPAAARGVACVRALVAPASGTLAGIDVDTVRTSPGVGRVLLDARLGQRVTAVRTNRDRLGFVLTHAPSATAARTAAETAVARAVVRVVDDPSPVGGDPAVAGRVTPGAGRAEPARTAVAEPPRTPHPGGR